MKRKNICIIGPLGAGKSTCISLLLNKDYTCISSGKLIRAAGLDVSSGKLIDDQLVVSLIFAEMCKTSKSIIHDGFPRTVEQGLEFLKLGEKIDYMFYLKLSDTDSFERVANRLVCSNPLCQSTYNRNDLNSANGNICYCKYCGSTLTIRPDDNATAIKKRYDIFQVHLKDIITFCDNYNIPFVEINAKKTSIDICKEILAHLNNS